MSDTTENLRAELDETLRQLQGTRYTLDYVRKQFTVLAKERDALVQAVGKARDARDDAREQLSEAADTLRKLVKTMQINKKLLELKGDK